jgi:hypothetical protein
MTLSNAERQPAWHERRKGEPRGNKALLAKLATLQACVDDRVWAIRHVAGRTMRASRLRRAPHRQSAGEACYHLDHATCRGNSEQSSFHNR